MNYEECMLAILANPEDDAPRRELAKFVRPSDRDLAEFIEFQLDHSRKARATRVHDTPERDSQLLRKHSAEWTRDLRFYLGEAPFALTVEFHRGLPWLCSMNPYTFLEHGEYIFNRVAPLRGVEFFADPEGDPFPAKEIAASPLLARLEEIRFHADTLRDGDLAMIASSTYLERVMAWTIVRENALSLEDFQAFAANPHTRKCLMISNRYHVPSDDGPIGECYARSDMYPTRYFGVSKEGQALERKHGYLPWLHKVNICDPKDALYWVEHQVLPKYVPGASADAPTPYGVGLDAEDTFEPREKFDARSFDSYW